MRMLTHHSPRLQHLECAVYIINALPLSHYDLFMLAGSASVYNTSSMYAGSCVMEDR